MISGCWRQEEDRWRMRLGHALVRHAANRPGGGQALEVHLAGPVVRVEVDQDGRPRALLVALAADR